MVFSGIPWRSRTKVKPANGNLYPIPGRADLALTTAAGCTQGRPFLGREQPRPARPPGLRPDHGRRLRLAGADPNELRPLELFEFF